MNKIYALINKFLGILMGNQICLNLLELFQLMEVAGYHAWNFLLLKYKLINQIYVRDNNNNNNKRLIL